MNTPHVHRPYSRVKPPLPNKEVAASAVVSLNSRCPLKDTNETPRRAENSQHFLHLAATPSAHNLLLMHIGAVSGDLRVHFGTSGSKFTKIN